MLNIIAARIDRLLNSERNQRIVLLVGPAGVGKSVVCKYSVDEVTKRYFSTERNDKQTIPAILVEANAPESGGFDWRLLYADSVEAMHGPLVDNSISLARRAIHGKFVDVPDFSARPGTLKALRTRFYSVVEQRKTTNVFIDEGSNILSTDNSQSLLRQANVLKTIVNKTNIRIVLAGAYDLFVLATKSGQLARRTAIVHFEPYSMQSIKDFTKALVSLQEYLPFYPPVSLEPFASNLFSSSQGCVGNLKDVLYDAVDRAIDANTTITKELLNDSYLAPEQIRQLRSEMFEGYKKVTGRPHPDDDKK